MPLPALLLSYAAGLAGGAWLFPAPWFPALPVAAGLAWLAARRCRLAGLLLILLCFTFGVARYQQANSLPAAPHALWPHAGTGTLTIDGSVLAVDTRPGGRSQLDLVVSSLEATPLRRTVHGRLRLFLRDPADGILPGDRVRFRSPLQRPSNFGTPGEFDYVRYLARRGIFTTARLQSSRDLVRFSDSRATPSVLASWRMAAGRFLSDHLPHPRAILQRALLLGDRGGFTAELRDRLARSGLTHLFAISGMHLALVAGFLYAAALVLYRRSTRLLNRAPPRRVLPLLLLPLLFGYLLFTGNALSTERAFLAAAGTALYLGLSRRTPPFRLWCAVAFAMLLFDPLAFFEPGFQLSFAGAAGLILLLPAWYPAIRDWPRPLRWPAGLLLATLAATLATFPLVLWHFHRVAPAGLLANLLAVPLIGMVALPLGLVGLALAPVSAAGASLVLNLSARAVELALAAGASLADWGPLQARFWYVGPLAAGGCALLVVAVILATRQRPFHRLSLVLTPVALLLIVLPPAAPGTLELFALSVGQGEATLVRLADGRHLLVDGGGSANPWFDVGERLVAPALGRLGVRSLAAVVLTHNHPDHYLGLRRVLAAFPVAEFWMAAGSPLPKELAPVLARRPVRIRRFPPGWHQPAATSLPVAVYAPPAATRSTNDRSLVLYAGDGRHGALLTGDLEADGVRRLLASSLPGPVDLLKLPHHGSRHSAPMLLVDSLHPRQVFVSVGHNNVYGLPAPAVVQGLADRDLPLWRTDRDGSLAFRAEPSGWREEGFFVDRKTGFR